MLATHCVLSDVVLRQYGCYGVLSAISIGMCTNTQVSRGDARAGRVGHGGLQALHAADSQCMFGHELQGGEGFISVEAQLLHAPGAGPACQSDLGRACRKRLQVR